MLAQYDQFDGALFQSVEHLQSPFLPEICLQRPHDLVVIVADGLELPVKLCQPDVVVERCFVDFHDLDFALEKYSLDKLRVAIQFRFLEFLSKQSVFVIIEIYHVAMLYRIGLRLAAAHIARIFLRFHRVQCFKYVLPFVLCQAAPTLEEDASAPAGSGEVLCCTKTFVLHKTQLAVNACSRKRHVQSTRISTKIGSARTYGKSRGNNPIQPYDLR